LAGAILLAVYWMKWVQMIFWNTNQERIKPLPKSTGIPHLLSWLLLKTVLLRCRYPAISNRTPQPPYSMISWD
jgi:hypothetical protein